MLRVAIVGTGAIAPMHVEAYLEFSEEVKIVALCDIYPEKAEKMAAKYNLDSAIYDDHQDMLKNEEIDLVSVCTPPYVHAEIAINSMKAGSNTVVEKPMAASLKECDDMIETSEETGQTLSVISQNRFTNDYMKLKALLDEKVIGKILHTQVDSFWWRGNNYYDLWWRGTWEKEGGGCTLNHAVHHLDIFKWLNGQPKEIRSVMSNVAHDNAEVEDISIALGKYEDGSLATLTSSVIHHGQEQQMIFQGETGRLSAPFKVYASKTTENGFPEENNELMKDIDNKWQALDDLAHEGHTGQLNNVIQHLLGNEDLVVDGDQGKETLELIMAIYSAAESGETVTLPLEPSHPYYTKEGILKQATRFHEKSTSIENFSQTDITT
ncbi:Predicted dehydrogenase [Alkalibacterium putridalgicola]|uniref:Oxidoreductase n=1 Tax=Alkalibacterium putridalgicola TaxID=426703 RepID=A0A1H7R9R5_9LACT|nr:Gfo/Idh/MocA family oxidoreductase [Alkalibacterium putridalgicola]GEK88846.1 oxidoreductase [Alkalibacterium putridalgicola]SEL56889.1 Predicted dehydrogenase [Alkalibacterium putridalgicola]